MVDQDAVSLIEGVSRAVREEVTDILPEMEGLKLEEDVVDSVEEPERVGGGDTEAVADNEEVFSLKVWEMDSDIDCEGDDDVVGIVSETLRRRLVDEDGGNVVDLVKEWL